MVNPDGLAYDLGGSPIAPGARTASRRLGQLAPTADIGTDLNRNYGYRFGCCGASSGDPASPYYRGPRAWSAPETRAMRDFVLSRVVDGRQRIRTHITFHTAGEMVLWPYSYTRADRPPDMRAIDLRAFRAMGRAMAATNGYTRHAVERHVPHRRRPDRLDVRRARASSRSPSSCTPRAAARRGTTTRPTRSSAGRPGATARPCCTSWSRRPVRTRCSGRALRNATVRPEARSEAGAVGSLASPESSPDQ